MKNVITTAYELVAENKRLYDTLQEIKNRVNEDDMTGVAWDIRGIIDPVLNMKRKSQ